MPIISIYLSIYLSILITHLQTTDEVSIDLRALIIFLFIWTIASEEHGITPSMVEMQEVLLSQVAQAVARMEITSPEVLRVTCAHQTLQGCGRVFRSDRDLYHKSRRCECPGFGKRPSGKRLQFAIENGHL